MTAIATEEAGNGRAPRLIPVRDGGIVAIAKGPGGAGGRPMTALRVQGYDGPEDWTGAEVQLEGDELFRVVRELAERLTDDQRAQLADLLSMPA